MRRLQLGLAMVALPVFAFSLFVAGCSKDEKKTETGGGGSEVKEDKSKGGEVKVLESKGGVLKGKINLKGSPPIEMLDKELTAAINAKADQKDYCLMAKDASEKSQQSYRVGENKGLGNVFVWIVPDEGTFFKVTKDQLEEAKKNPVKIRQPHCAFIPHAAFLFSQYRPDPKSSKREKTGQILEVVNDATISHNTNWKGGAKNQGANVVLDAGKDRKVDDLQAEMTPVTIKCNIHGWMDAYLRVVDTPYYAISYSDTLDGKNKVEKGDDKFGTYEIKNLPVGKVKVFAWHEKSGYLNKGEGKGEVVEIKEGAATAKDFEAEAK
jgi:hypothetical protein